MAIIPIRIRPKRGFHFLLIIIQSMVITPKYGISRAKENLVKRAKPKIIPAIIKFFFVES